MRIPLAILALILAFPAAAQRSYAVLSLVGDRIDIVQHAGTVGTSLDRNRRDSAPMDDRLIDRAIVGAADKAIRRRDNEATPVLLMARDPSIYAAQERMLDDERSVQTLLAALRPVLADVHATHLLLFTRLRHGASFELGNFRVGSGMLDGAGFYVDSTLRTRRGDTQENAVGFLGPYVYMEATLVDLGSALIVGQKQLLETRTLSAARSTSGNAWDTLTMKQKVDLLVRMSSKGASDAVEVLLSSP
jgi:hypothetical protein